MGVYALSIIAAITATGMLSLVVIAIAEIRAANRILKLLERENDER